jgi:hypothetical protein
MRWYGFPALLSLAICQYLMFQKVEPVYTFFTAIQWWNYILLIDAIVAKHQKSLIFNSPAEFIVMLVLSNVCWLVFEGYNLLLKNWYYTNLATDRWQVMLGAAVAFATIFPGIFLSADLFETAGLFRSIKSRSRKLSASFLIGSFAGGLAAVVFPLIFPSPYVFGLVWLGFFFLLEPINYWQGSGSIYADIEKGNWRRFWLLLAGGALCGFLWEFWNYWAGAKWIYTVPFTKNLKYFEMPVLGLLGFPPFALECFAMYHFTRRLLSRSAELRL